MKTLLVCVTVVLFLACCDSHKGELKTQLELADSLVNEENYEEASEVFNNIDIETLLEDEDKALYYLLKLQTDFTLGKETKLDTLIDFSIDYYNGIGNYEKLSRAYYYKGMSKFRSGDVNESLFFMKEAEMMEKKANVAWLRYAIYLNMSFINNSLGTNRTALHYARKALDCAMENNNVQWICFAYNNIANSYDGLGKRDSAFFYIEKIMPYLDKIKETTVRAGYLTNIGYLYYDKKNYAKAESLLRRALALSVNPTTQINLAKTCYMLGKDAEGDTLFNKAWPEASDEEKVEILQFRAAQAEKSGDFATSSRLYKDAHAMQDSVRRNMKTEETVMAQSDYERDRYKERVNRSVVAAGAAVLACVALLVATLVIYYQKRINRAKKTITEGNRLITEYTEKISELERQDASHADKVSDLKQKIRKLRNDQATVLGNGQRLYDDIAAGGTTATWKKKEFDEFIEFYRLNHADAVADAENNYRRLPSSNIFYLLLVDMQRNDADVQRIMCMTAGALRTMKSRINAKKVA